MTIRFVARAAGADVDPDGDFTAAGLSEGADGSGFVLLFQCGALEPDEQDVVLGLDTHCLVTADQGTAYGCVREAVLAGNVLTVSLDPAALDDLGLDDPEIEGASSAGASIVSSVSTCRASSRTADATPCPAGCRFLRSERDAATGRHPRRWLRRASQPQNATRCEAGGRRYRCCA
jgi:hypothetical protein